MFFFFLGERSQRIGPGDIGSSFQIMTAGIHQIEAPGFQRNICFRRDRIVDDGPVGTVTADSLKA